MATRTQHKTYSMSAGCSSFTASCQHDQHPLAPYPTHLLPPPVARPGRTRARPVPSGGAGLATEPPAIPATRHSDGIPPKPQDRSVSDYGVCRQVGHQHARRNDVKELAARSQAKACGLPWRVLPWSHHARKSEPASWRSGIVPVGGGELGRVGKFVRGPVKWLAKIP